MLEVLERIPIRWRLAVVSAALTFVILSAFAVVIGQVTASRVRSDFNNQLAAAVDDLSDRFNFRREPLTTNLDFRGPDLDVYAAANTAVIRVLQRDGRILDQTRGAPNFGILLPRTAETSGYRVETRLRNVPVRRSPIVVPLIVQYGRKVSDVEATVKRVRLFLGGGVLAGTMLALLGGLVVGRRAMAPVAALTAGAREIAETRDPGRALPRSRADDEVAELGRTLQDMLDALESSRTETEDALARQRQFVADASHELRTPLTSILANLELLAEVLDGEQGETARSALRSSQRMRRLVGDLLLLARADARRTLPRAPTDVGQVLVDVAAELGPVAQDHHLAVETQAAIVEGSRDELHRMVLNLMENAVRHTPPGSRVHAAVRRREGEVVLTVEDDGPGVPDELRERVFERFVRGDGDTGSSSGLGLSIVRAVAESHGGTVTLEDAEPGARFVVRLPPAAAAAPAEAPATPQPTPA
ncbi:MAG TPA: HAMP domain-containing sensor histidine kinase [Solirubrobacteraceae bacterium]|nr:HAMP domain-containing sensor histidine kinase [Solirubrobacteraceae bacterium]